MIDDRVVMLSEIDDVQEFICCFKGALIFKAGRDFESEHCMDAIIKALNLLDRPWALGFVRSDDWKEVNIYLSKISKIPHRAPQLLSICEASQVVQWLSRDLLSDLFIDQLRENWPYEDVWVEQAWGSRRVLDHLKQALEKEKAENFWHVDWLQRFDVYVSSLPLTQKAQNLCSDIQKEMRSYVHVPWQSVTQDKRQNLQETLMWTRALWLKMLKQDELIAKMEDLCQDRRKG